MGGPDIKVDGGMTEDQYAQLQSEERQWQSDLEDKKYARAMEYEKEKRDYDQAMLEKMEAQKGAEELAVEAGELAIQGEITAQDEDEEEGSNMDTDFYDSLAMNETMNPRPE